MFLRVLFGVGLIAAAFYLVVQLGPDSFFNREAQKFGISPSSLLNKTSQKTLSKTCQLFMAELKKNKLSNKFQKVIIQARDERLNNVRFLKELYGCFTVDKMGSLFLEIEAFTSDFNGQLSDDLQLQVSVYDFVTQNKLTEFGFVYHLPAEPGEKETAQEGSVTLKTEL